MSQDEAPLPETTFANLEGKHVLICPKHRTLARLICMDYTLRGFPPLPIDQQDRSPTKKDCMMLGYGCPECHHAQRHPEELRKELLWIILPRSTSLERFLSDIDTQYLEMNRESDGQLPMDFDRDLLIRKNLTCTECGHRFESQSYRKDRVPCPCCEKWVDPK